MDSNYDTIYNNTILVNGTSTYGINIGRNDSDASPEYYSLSNIDIYNNTITALGKYGEEVEAGDWKEVYGRNVVVGFSDSNHWAYAEQIKRIR